MAESLIGFLNNVDLRKLCASLDQLDEETTRIFASKDASLDTIILEEIKKTDPHSFVWFCFLRANFLRGKDIYSNKAFRELVEYSHSKENNFYFDSFPRTSLLPDFQKPKFRHAHQVEAVLKQVATTYGSGKKFAKSIESIVCKGDEMPLLYMEIISRFMQLKQIGMKIANAIANEIAGQMATLHRLGEAGVLRSLLSEPWMKKLLLVTSCFNVMIDVHVKNFFKDKMEFKDVDHSILILLGSLLKTEVTKALFERNYGWIPGKENLMGRYRDFIGASVLEKVIWTAYFVKSNAGKKNISDLQFFKLTGNMFL